MPEFTRRRRSYDLLKTIVVLGVVFLTSTTLNTLPYLQSVLDSACCGRNDIPLLDRSIHGGKSSSSSSSPCLVHKPLILNSVARVETTNLTSTPVLEQPSASICGPLRRDWRQNRVLSATGREIQAHQSNCSLPVATFHVDNDFGLGSHLYLWSQALCNAQESGYRVRTYNPHWLWLDTAYCDSKQAVLSPFLCYFPAMEYRCDMMQDENVTAAVNVTNPRDVRQRFSRIQQEEGLLTEFRAAAMEYIFQQVSPIVIQEAERQVGLLFGEAGAPSDLITVHIRWGDKFWEMDLAPIDEYVTAVCEILQLQGQPDNTTANIYLATEDPRAVQEFVTAVPPGWKVYKDRTVVELNAFRPVKGNRASWTTRNTQGRAGLVALGSLLVAMEANYFVLTTASNWSRLMNELRKNVINVRCRNCTHMIDLRPGEW